MVSQIILGVKVTNFAENSKEAQSIFSEYGCHICTRIGLHGLHAAADSSCNPNGLVLLEFVGGKELANEMVTKLEAVPGITVKMMEF